MSGEKVETQEFALTFGYEDLFSLAKIYWFYLSLGAFGEILCVSDLLCSPRPPGERPAH